MTLVVCRSKGFVAAIMERLPSLKSKTQEEDTLPITRPSGSGTGSGIGKD